MSKTKSTPSPARSGRDLLQDARLKVTGPRLSVIDQLLAREKGYEIIQHELIVYVRPVERQARRAGELPK